MKLKDHDSNIKISLDTDNGGAVQLETTSDHGGAGCCAASNDPHEGHARTHEHQDGTGPYATASFGLAGMTCQACARKVDAALSGIPGVLKVFVDLAGRRATVSFDQDSVGLDDLRSAVEATGYSLLPESETEGEAEESNQLTRLRGPFAHPRPYLVGLAAALTVVGFYLGLITLTSDWYFARSQFSEYRWWILALAAGLGVQAILYTALRGQLMGRHKKAAKSSLAASGGVSTLSMAACCAHYLVAFLPALGLPFLSTALASLDQYQSYFFLAGVISNLFGIGLMLRLLTRNGMLPRLAVLSN
jgi:copper chaperone CopZ